MTEGDERQTERRHRETEGEERQILKREKETGRQREKTA